MSLRTYRVRTSIAVSEIVDELSSKGVTFERYDDPVLKTDERGIHELGDGRVAWFKDPDGNTFAIEDGTP
jgi:hypothetical protein